jgi:hypothetical protein
MNDYFDRHGPCEMYRDDGMTFSGTYSTGFYGCGTMVQADGTEYKGMFFMSNKRGFGCLTSKGGDTKWGEFASYSNLSAMDNDLGLTGPEVEVEMSLGEFKQEVKDFKQDQSFDG